MDLENKIMSDVVVHMKYAKYKDEENRREVWSEIVQRNMQMHIDHYPHLEIRIREVYQMVFDKKVLPSMRSMQFGGAPIELAHNRIYNCAYMPISHIDAFSEMMFLLLGGTGAGFSVQWRHVAQLPVVRGCKTEARKFLVGDSIEGWADAVKVLVESHFLGKERVRFDLRDIREKGARLVTSGGKAPGPEPLKECLLNVNEVLLRHQGNRLSPLAAYDICCYIADAVLAGGIRRAATICLFDKDDEGMLQAKTGEFYKYHPQRQRSNNSMVLERGKVSEEEFRNVMHIIKENNTGEPGVYWSNNPDWGTNPCCEVGLQAYQFCNLVDINMSDIKSVEDFYGRCAAAAFIATLQAGYTDFHYLRSVWKEKMEEEYLIGVGQTGIASIDVSEEVLQNGAHIVKRYNRTTAEQIGISPAARTTTVKPSGTSSIVLGCSSGVHAWHGEFYIRRVTIMENESIFKYLKNAIPELLEESITNRGTWFLTVPQKAPVGAALRSESMLTLLERVKKYNISWVRAGHVEGDNTHNVSCTISVKDDEWEQLTDWMWTNRDTYNGIAVLPYWGGTVPQMPFEDCTEERYNELVKHLREIDLTMVIEEKDNTTLASELACSGDKGCEIL